MKMIKSIIPKAAMLILLITILCGGIYPLLVTGISGLVFREKANGTIIEVNGVKYGSELLGQQYTGAQYLWGRIMNIDTKSFTNKKGKAVLYAAPSNLSPASEKYKELVAKRVEAIKQSNPDAVTDKIPVDLVTCSGSGLDPHISVAAAVYQIPRIAKQRGISENEVKSIIDKYTAGRFLGVFGEKTVNVLEVNLALDGIL